MNVAGHWYLSAVPAPPPGSVATGFSLPAPDLQHSEAVHESWRDYFRTLPVGARLLDIAPGIGALSLIAQEVSREQDRSFEVHSLDQAATLSAAPLLLDGIRFHARRYDDSTPFTDGYFDAISAQWAVPEDGGIASGLAELRRILKPGGRLRLLFHAAGGANHEQCLGRMRAVDALLDEFRLLEHARHMFEVAFTHETALKRDVLRAAMLTMESQDRYARVVQQLRLWSPGTPNPQAAEQVVQLIEACWRDRQALTLVEITAQLDRVEERLRSAQTRLRAITGLAVDETRAHRIARLFKAAGFPSVKVRPFKLPAADVLLGWDLIAV